MHTLNITTKRGNHAFPFPKQVRRVRGLEAATSLPPTIEIFSSNGMFKGSLHLHEYLGRINPKGHLPDCIEEVRKWQPDPSREPGTNEP